MEIRGYEREIRRERRWRNMFIGIAVVLFIGFSYYWYQDDSVVNSYNSLSSNYNSLLSNYNTLNTRYSSLLGRNSYLNGSLTELQREMENMLQAYDQKSVVYTPASANTTVNIWGLRQTIGPKSWIEWALLDTFVNHLDISSNATATYVIVDPANFVQLYDNITLHQNTTFMPSVQYTGTHFTRTERLSQGCSGYMLVIINYSSHPVLLMPNVTATYAPTAFLTEQCSLTP
jgi:hypothetical protein